MFSATLGFLTLFTGSRTTLAVNGVATGFGSALTGTGGPLLLIPALIWFGIPALTAIGTGIGFMLAIGATTALLLPPHLPKTLVSWLLVIVGAVLLFALMIW